MQNYESIFWDSSWAHQKYYGWQLMYEIPSFKVLRKQRCLLKRYLVLTTLTDIKLIESKMNRTVMLGPFSEVILHSFSTGADLSNCFFAGRKFAEAENRNRILNKATFVIDLTQENEVLWNGMSPDYRRDCRKAQGQGMMIEALENPPADLLNEFFGRYEKMAMERGLDIPDRSLIERMLVNNDLVLIYVKEGDTVLSMALIYITGKKAYYLYGINGQRKNDLSGRYLHWGAMNFLKKQGVLWYDLGGVPEISEKNGIYLFKKRFGGDLVLLGTEYFHQPFLVKTAYHIFQQLKKLSAWQSIIRRNILRKNI